MRLPWPGPHFRRALTKLFGESEEQLGLTHSGMQTASQTPALVSLYDSAIPLAPTTPLVGRDDDLARIKAQLCQSGSSVVLTAALNGIPGVGKTALSIALVHDPDIRAYFHDGILWAGLGPTPNISGLFGRWAKLLGLSQAHFAELDFDQKRSQIRTAIATRSMLIIMDDVWQLETALALRLGGPNCAYLVTTRFSAIATHLVIGNAIMIEELNEEQSVHLLRLLAPQFVSHEETKVRSLVGAVGGLPLALTLIGNFLRKQTSSPRRISAALDKLSVVDECFRISEPHIQSEEHPSIPSSVAISLSSIIEVSDHHLTASARQTLYALSVFPAKPKSFSEAAALSVAACPTHALDELVDAGLLEAQGEGRYRLHQIIADYARMKQNVQTEEVVTRRLIAYMRAYVEQHAKEYELLEQEITLILCVLERAVMSEVFQPQVLPFICAVAPFLLMRGYFQETQRFLDHAYEWALASCESECTATVLLFLGQVSEKRGDLSRAKQYYQQGLAELINPVTLRGVLMRHVGRMSWKMGNYQEAEALLQEGLAFARATEQPELICEMCRTLAALYSMRADYQQAERYAREGLSIARQLGDREQIVALLVNLGCSLPAHPSRSVFLHEALLIAREIKSDEQYCIILINLGDCSTNSRDFSQAEAYLREAISIARRLGISEWISTALSALTTVLRQQGRLSEAEACIQEALLLAKEGEHPRCVCIALDKVGNLALARGNAKQAIEAFREMLHLCPEGDDEMQAMGMFGLGRASEQLEQYAQALSFGKQALKLLQQKKLVQYIERVRIWYTNLIQRVDSHVQDWPSVETCICGKPLERASGSGRTRRYCSDRCRKRAQRERGTNGAGTK
jgi:tetratricopeptide (TPR) repeat protein